MRPLLKPIFALALLVLAAAGCGDFLPVAACGTCEGFAAKQNPQASAGCCGRGCVITDVKCKSGYRYVGGSGKTLAECADPLECYYPEASVPMEDLSPAD
jgi:hypothetical protein